jgi:tRNA nucleotidyltransferase (CCA-adding enzyme)
VFLPEFDVMMETPQNNPHHLYSVGMHTIKALELSKRDKIARLTTLLHDIGKPATRTTDEAGIDHFSGHPNLGTEVARKILKRLRFDNDTIDRVSLLVLYHDYGNAVSATPAFTRRLIHRVKLENFPLLLEVKRVDILAQSDLDRDKKLEKLASLNSAYQEVLEKRLCVSLKELAVSGSDLIQAGMKPGQELGKVLKLLLDEVLEEPTLNKKEVLIELTKRWGYV